MSNTRARAGGVVSRRKVWKWGLGAAAGSVLASPAVAYGSAASVDADPTYLALAAEPAALMVGGITRNETGAAISAEVIWPDGVGGIYLADEIDPQCGAVNSYHVTYGSNRTYVQPRVSRDSAGFVVYRPGMRIS